MPIKADSSDRMEIHCLINLPFTIDVISSPSLCHSGLASALNLGPKPKRISCEKMKIHLLYFT